MKNFNLIDLVEYLLKKGYEANLNYYYFDGTEPFDACNYDEELSNIGGLNDKSFCKWWDDYKEPYWEEDITDYFINIDKDQKIVDVIYINDTPINDDKPSVYWDLENIIQEVIYSTRKRF